MKLALQCALLSRAGGGLPAAVLPVADRLARTDGVTLLTTAAPEEPPRAPVRTLRARGPLVMGAGAALAAADPDMVHTHGLWTGLSAAALAWHRRSGRPHAVSPHGMLDPWALAKSRLRKRVVLTLFERAHLNDAAFIHALNAAEARAIRAAGLTAPIAIVPNGTDPAPPPPDRPAFMDRPTLLFLGRITPKKGVAELIAAFAAAALPGWRLALAGWEDDAGDIRARAAATGADIVFPGPLFGADKAAAYAHAAAFVLPSHSEGLPMTVLEAWAAGCPVLMTEACNLPEGFTAGAAARIGTDPGQLAQSLIRHLNDAAWRDRAGTAGRALVAERFDWDPIAATFRALYAHALGQGPRPDVFHD